MSVRQRKPAFRRDVRPAFTLIEVLLTTVLTATLLAALWSLMSMYLKIFELGQAKTEQSQLARTLLRQMSDDLHSVIVAPPRVVSVPLIAPAMPATPPSPPQSSPSSSPAPSGSAAGSAPVTSVTPSFVKPLTPLSVNSVPNVTAIKPQTPAAAGGSSTSSAGNSSSGQVTAGPSAASANGDQTVVVSSSLRPAGLFGTETYLQIEIFQPTDVSSEGEAPLVSPPGAAAPTRAAELRTVVYAFEESPDPNQRLGEARMCLTRRELDWEQAHPAAKSATTGRRPGPRRAGPPGGAAPGGDAPSEDTGERLPIESETTVLGQDAAVSVPEVVQFALRYFDGATWVPEWDSVARQELPLAVEITLQLHSVESAASALAAPPPHADPGDAAPPRLPHRPAYRLVVHLPPATGPKPTPSGLFGLDRTPGDAQPPARKPAHAARR